MKKLKKIAYQHTHPLMIYLNQHHSVYYDFHKFTDLLNISIDFHIILIIF